MNDCFAVQSREGVKLAGPRRAKDVSSIVIVVLAWCMAVEVSGSREELGDTE